MQIQADFSTCTVWMCLQLAQMSRSGADSNNRWTKPITLPLVHAHKIMIVGQLEGLIPRSEDNSTSAW